MSFEPLPQKLEQGVQRFAALKQISHDEAVLMLIETGLNLVPAAAFNEGGQNPAEELIGLFSSAEDWLVMGEIVASAYEGREMAAGRDTAI